MKIKDCVFKLDDLVFLDKELSLNLARIKGKLTVEDLINLLKSKDDLVLEKIEKLTRDIVDLEKILSDNSEKRVRIIRDLGYQLQVYEDKEELGDEKAPVSEHVKEVLDEKKDQE